MKKVAIASCYFKLNYGSVLQAYATQKILDIWNIPNETIDISGFSSEISKGKRRYYMKNLLNFSMYLEKKGFVRHILKQKIDKNHFGKNIALRKNSFQNFRKNNFRMSKRYISKSELTQACSAYSDIIVGSDQLWLPLNIEGDYYTLNFAPDHVNKIAYSTSFGVSVLPEYIMKKTADFLNRIQHISVREQSGKKLVSDITGKSVPVVCDPTLLLSYEQWMDIQEIEPFIDGSYIFCYFLSSAETYREFAKRLKKESGYKIVTFRHLDEYIPRDESFGDISLYDASPSEFINIIRNAKYVCTDSFHGTIFSLINRKTFFTFRRYKNGSINSTNTRYETLLELAGLSDRIFTGKENVRDCMNAKINYDVVDSKIGELRASSMQFLEKALGMIDKETNV